MNPRTLILAFLFSFLGPAIQAQTLIVVDAAGGPGARYRDLPPAVAGAPSGSILLVRPGNYTPFRVFGKILRIKGSGPDKTAVIIPPVGGKVTIDCRGKHGTFLLEDLSIKVLLGSYAPLAPFLELTAGDFYLREVKITSPSFGSVLAPQSGPHGLGDVVVAQSRLLACHLEINACAAVFLNQPKGSLPPALYALQSLLQLTDCKIHGSGGGANERQKNGQPGIKLSWSTLDLFKGTIRGGWGGVGNQSPGYFRPGNGGPAIYAGRGSLVLGEGTTLLGGANGYYMAGMSGWRKGVPAPGIYLEAGSGADFHGSQVKGGCEFPLCRNTAGPYGGPGIFVSRKGPVHRPALDLSHAGTSPGSAKITVTGVPGRPHVLLVGLRSTWIPLGPLGFPGTLLVDPREAWVIPFRLSSKGTWNLPIPSPGGIPAGPFWIQAFMAPEGKQVVSSNAAALVLW